MKKFNRFRKTCFMLMGAFALFVLIAVAFLLVSVDLKAADKPAKASTEENKAMVRHAYEDIFGKGKLESADKYFAANYVHRNPYDPPGTPPGPEGVKQAITMFRSAFPDMQITIEDMVAEGKLSHISHIDMEALFSP